VGVTPINLSHAGRTLFEVDKLVQFSLLDYSYICLLIKYKKNIHQMHRDHVPHVPAPFLPLGNTPIAANQGMILLSSRSSQLADNSATSATGETTTAFAPGDIHILTVQGHPEFTNAIVNKVVDAREGSGVLTAATASDARDRNATLQHDGVDIVGRAMWRILGVLA
jgi:GMP synthase-like glutamine amidotransferase